jgi:hypothetical protein
VSLRWRAAKPRQLAELIERRRKQQTRSGLKNMGKARRKPRAPGNHLALKPGHDGLPPVHRPARDIAGIGKRNAPDGPQNINVDRLEWLLAHKLIEPHHHAAGRILQRHAEQAEISAGVSLVGGGGGGGNASTLSDAKCDALTEINRARAAISPLNWRVIELVVIDGASMERAAGKMGYNARGALPVLRGALDQLGRHYRLC